MRKTVHNVALFAPIIRAAAKKQKHCLLIMEEREKEFLTVRPEQTVNYGAAMLCALSLSFTFDAISGANKNKRLCAHRGDEPARARYIYLSSNSFGKHSIIMDYSFSIAYIHTHN